MKGEKIKCGLHIFKTIFREAWIVCSEKVAKSQVAMESPLTNLGIIFFFLSAFLKKKFFIAFKNCFKIFFLLN